ncbi:MAG: hypothetical protein IJ666_09040 [Ruminococcus sp.]|nr:hypothetical protein [Ruminococcus sp.]
MKRFTAFLLALVLCLTCLVSVPAHSSDFDYADTAYEIVSQYQLMMQAEQNALLSQFFTYSYLGCANYHLGELTEEYAYNLVVTGIERRSKSSGDYDVVNCGTGSYYYKRSEGYAIPHLFTGSLTMYENRVSINGNTYYFEPPTQNSGVITYCDIADSYYSDSKDVTSLQRHELLIKPPYNMGSVTSPRDGSTLGDNINAAKQLVAPEIETTIATEIVTDGSSVDVTVNVNVALTFLNDILDDILEELQSISTTLTTFLTNFNTFAANFNTFVNDISTSFSADFTNVTVAVNDIPESIRQILIDLFVPTRDDYFEEIIDIINAKFGFIYQIIELGDVLVDNSNAFTNNQPSFGFKFTNHKYFGDLYVNFVDWSKVSNYVVYVKAITSGITLYFFIRRTRRRLPEIISGGGC